MEKKTKEFKPFIPADKVLPEFTVTSIILGIILAVVFGAANAYLGLRVGMTISASIPAAVLSMGIIRIILRKDSILENNMVQTIGSAGESLAAGAIFTLPALFLWAEEGKIPHPSMMEITMITFVGGVLGILFMIPLRKALIVEEHGKLPFPEGTACAEVLLAGEEGGAKAGTVFRGLGVASLYKFVSDGLKIFPSTLEKNITFYSGSAAGLQVLPALAGVGYICGPRISSFIFAGGTMSWFVILPIIAMFGKDATVFPATEAISSMEPGGLWDAYVRYIGAGAVAAGGIISLVKSMPLIVKTFKQSMKSLSKKDVNAGGETVLRTDKDLSFKVIILALVVIIACIWLVPIFPLNLFGAILVVIFGFFFATVSARMVGLIGSSNNPISGMAIATLIITTFLLKATGTDGTEGMVGAIAICAIICVVSAIAGDTSQDLKTGFLAGATPYKQQIGEIIGAIASAIAIGWVMNLLNSAWGFGSEQIPAPQGVMMKMIVEGIMESKLPWNLIIIGVAIAVVIEILGIPVMPFAVGMYLPVSVGAGIMCGGIVRWAVEKRKAKASEEERYEAVERGTLYSSGMIAGEGLVGLILAGIAAAKKADAIDLSGVINIGQTGALVIWIILLVGVYRICIGKKSGRKGL